MINEQEPQKKQMVKIFVYDEGCAVGIPYAENTASDR